MYGILEKLTLLTKNNKEYIEIKRFACRFLVADRKGLILKWIISIIDHQQESFFKQ